MLFDGVDGIKVYDPRDGVKKVSDNPALILGHLVTVVQGSIVGDGFWPGIGKLADFCEDEYSFPLTEEAAKEEQS